MLDNKSLIVLAYLKNHFSKNSTYIERIDLLSIGLSSKDIDNSIAVLESKGCINVNHKYVSKPIESINL